MAGKSDLQHAKRSMQSVYRRNADQFDRNRSRSLFEKKWLDKFLALLPKGGSVLDVGCGSGEPIAQYIIGSGFSVTGTDYSPEMLALAKRRWPENRWIEMDMREWRINETFDGVLAWNSFFHLSPDEQRSTLPKILKSINAGGAFMTTIGTSEGETDGWVAGERVYHGSLTIEEYGAILNDSGFEISSYVLSDKDCQGHSVLLAKRVA